MTEENRLKALLYNEGLTQADLARESGVSTGTIRKVCENRGPTTLITKYKILMGLNRLSYAQYEMEDVFKDISNSRR